MIITMDGNATEEQVRVVLDRIDAKGRTYDVVRGNQLTTISVLGDATKISEDYFDALPGVVDVERKGHHYKKSLKVSGNGLVTIEVPREGRGPVVIGGHEPELTLIGGPCAVESRDQVMRIADAIKDDAHILRGGAWKPRKSPYDYQGTWVDGLDWLIEAGRENGLPVITELTGLWDPILKIDRLALFLDKGVDIIQVGMRHMENVDMAVALSMVDTPVLFKRADDATIDQYLNAVEYLLAGVDGLNIGGNGNGYSDAKQATLDSIRAEGLSTRGNQNVILCERGTLTYENGKNGRNKPDCSAVMLLRANTRLPVFADPSHAIGIRNLVKNTGAEYIAAGAIGLEVEVHNCPADALCDGAQSLTPDQFRRAADFWKRSYDLHRELYC